MALQVASPAGAVYAAGSYHAGRASRPLGFLGIPPAPSFCRSAATRPVTRGYLLEVPEPPPPAPDVTPPFVGNFDPPAGTRIAKTTPIAFDVTDESTEFGRIFVVAFFQATGISEVIHDGDGFRGLYAATSSRRAIASGFRYTVLRSHGWPSAPTIQTFAVDRAGNEAS